MERITGCEHLHDDELLAATKRIAAEGRGATERLLRHLGEIEHRKLHERAKYASLFLYCLRELRLSEAESWRRATVARTARRYPVIYEMIRGGELSLSAAALISPHLRADNYRALLRRCAGKGKREVEGILADMEGRKETRDRVRRLTLVAAPVSAILDGPAREGLLPIQSAPSAASPESSRSATTSADAPGLPARRVEIKFTADEALLSKLERIRELLRFRVAGARLEHILDVLAEAWLAKNAPERVLLERRRDSRNRGGTQRRGKGGRRVPTAVKAEVYRRDGGRCTYVAPSGGRCEESARLEFDHIIPYACGGANEAANLRLRCRAHNLLAARDFFGAEFVGAARGATGRARGP